MRSAGLEVPFYRARVDIAQFTRPRIRSQVYPDAMVFLRYICDHGEIVTDSRDCGRQKALKGLCTWEATRFSAYEYDLEKNKDLRGASRQGTARSL